MSERRYYSFHIIGLYSRIDRDRVKWFYQKYSKDRDVHSGDMKLIIAKPFFGDAVLLDKTYYYEENGTFYEFFSKQKIGVVKHGTLDSYYGKYVYMDVNPVNLPREFKFRIASNPDRDSIVQPHEISASQLAHAIKPLMKYKDKIARIMNEYFSIWHTEEEWRELKKREYEDEQRRIANEDTSFLDSHIMST